MRLVLLFASGVHAKDSDPEVFARAYLAALVQNDTAALAAGMHPTALRQFHSLLMPLFEGNSAARASTELLPMFSVKTPEELKRTSPQAFYAAFFTGLARVKPEYLDLMTQSRYEVLGHVPEKHDAHVVYRLEVRIDGQTAKRMVILSLRRNRGSWGVLLTTEAEGMAASLRRRYQ